MPNTFPVLQPDLRPYRGPNTSNDANRLAQDVFYDLMTLCTETNEQAKRISDLAEVTSISNAFLHMKVAELETRILQLEVDVAEAQGEVKHATTWVHGFQAAQSGLGLRQASIDLVRGMATLPESNAPISKVYLNDPVTGEPVLPKTLQVEILPMAAGGTTDTDPYHAVDGREPNIWIRKVALPVTNTTTEVQASVTVKLPDNIISNRDCNLITVHPFPLRGVDVMAVEARVNGRWQAVPGFDGPLYDAGPIKLCFAALPITELRVTLRQRRWLEQDQQKIFYLGAQEIGVWNQSYAFERGDMLIPIALPGPGAKLISDIRPIMANASALSDTTADKRSLFAYEVYTVDRSGNLVLAKDQLPILVNARQVVLKATLYADSSNSVAPALKGVECTYTITP